MKISVLMILPINYLHNSSGIQYSSITVHCTELLKDVIPRENLNCNVDDIAFSLSAEKYFLANDFPYHIPGNKS